MHEPYISFGHVQGNFLDATLLGGESLIHASGFPNVYFAPILCSIARATELKMSNPTSTYKL